MVTRVERRSYRSVDVPGTSDVDGAANSFNGDLTRELCRGFVGVNREGFIISDISLSEFILAEDEASRDVCGGANRDTSFSFM